MDKRTVFATFLITQAFRPSPGRVHVYRKEDADKVINFANEKVE